MKELTCIGCPRGCTLKIERNGDGWSVDLPMTKQDDGSWLTDEAYQMDAGV